jgi:hypothetical protein
MTGRQELTQLIRKTLSPVDSLVGMQQKSFSILYG